MSAKKSKEKKKGKGRKKSSAPQYRQRAIIAGLVLLVTVSIAVTLIYVRRPSPLESQKVMSGTSLLELRDDVRIEVESLLLRSGFSLNAISDDLVADTLVFKVSGDYPTSYQMEEFTERLDKISPSLLLRRTEGGAGFVVHWREKALCQVLFVAESSPVAASAARIAILVDDLGRDAATARSLLAIDLPVTFSILPGTAQAAKVATLAHLGGREVLIHLPMEPQGYPAINPGNDALLLRQSKEEMRQRLTGYLENVPYAVGGNNHMGSRFTENAEAMATVLEFMTEKGLFFVDSRTSGRSVGYRLALDRGMATAARDVFLDNVQAVDEIRAQFRKLVAQAQKKGQAIGICHPYPETLDALRQEAIELSDSEVTVVPVSALLSRQ